MVLAMAGLLGPASGAEGLYPFEGTWVRTDHVCTATTVRERVYTARDVTSPRGRCTIRRVAASGSVFELLEECRHNDRPTTVTETIRLTSPDNMTLRRQVSRLKIPRQVHYARCTAATASGHGKPPTPGETKSR